jgi:palmitoyltransferase
LCEYKNCVQADDSAGFFCIFTFTMFPTHVSLILTGMTTLESYAGREQMEMETSVLHREFGYVFNDHKKRQVKRRWKEEFGGVDVDQRWAVGSWMDRWKAEMGSSWLGWFCESGSSPKAGVG